MTNHHDEMRVAPDPGRAEALRRRLHERLASGSGDEGLVIQDAKGFRPSVDAGSQDRRGGLIVLESESRSAGDQPEVHRRRSSGPWLLVAAAAVVVIVGALVLTAGGADDDEIDTVSETPMNAQSPFAGAWVSTDTDGSTQTMYIDQWDTDTYRVAVSDETGTVCVGAGRLTTGTSLMVDRPARTAEASCGDGTGSFPPPQTEIELTLDLSTRPDRLVDSLGAVWRKQAAPPADTEDAALLRAFLEARVAGEGAERYVGSGFSRDDRVPLLYATTDGAAYERFEIERVQDPDGVPNYDVRLFTQGGTVVQQRFGVLVQDRRLVVVYGGPTLEDGHAALLPFSVLDGEVSFGVTSTWEVETYDNDHVAFRHRFGGSAIVIAAERLGVGGSCENGPAPADADALARHITDAGHDVSALVPVRTASIDGLQIDVTTTDQQGFLCTFEGSSGLGGLQSGGTRMRLYLLDSTGESAGFLTVAVMAAPDEFADAIAEATPIVDSVEVAEG